MKQQWTLRRRLYNGGMRGLVWLCAGLTCALLIFLIGYIFYRGVPGLSWQLISGQTSYIRNTVGILPNLLNTLYIILVAMAVVLPLGVGAAIYLTEYAASGRLVRIIEFAAETLTGIPSIIFGLVGMMLFVQKLGLQAGILAGGLTLVMMILPTIIRTTQESLKTVPQSYREGALALGAGKWHMVRTVVLPGAVDGIVTGCILAIGRIVGESAALLYTAGFGMALVSLFDSLHTSSATLTVALYVYATEGGETALAFSIATILMVLTLLINLTAFIGPSGCGKSTFLKTLNRMNDLVPGVKITGQVRYRGEDIYAPGTDVCRLRREIGMVFQKPNPFPMSIYDNIAYGPRTHGIRSKARLDELVERSLRGAAIWDEVKDRLKKNALGLSGGQQQRLCIARALAVEPAVLLMDEPTSALDPISTSRIEELTMELKERYTIVIVTHNMQQAVRISDHTAFFLLGELVEYGATEQVFSAPAEKRTEDYITGRFG